MRLRRRARGSADCEGSSRLVRLPREGELLLPAHCLGRVSIRTANSISSTIPPRCYARAPAQDIPRDLSRSPTSALRSPDHRFGDVHQPRPQHAVWTGLRQASFVVEGGRGRSVARPISRFPSNSRGDGKGDHSLKSRQRVEIKSSRLVGTFGRGYGPSPGSLELDRDPRSEGSRLESWGACVVADPTLFVAATVPAEGAFGGAHATLAIPFFPFVILERTNEASGRDPLFLLFLSVQGGGRTGIAGTKTVIRRRGEVLRSGTGGRHRISAIRHQMWDPGRWGGGEGLSWPGRRDGAGGHQVVANIRRFDILERLGDVNLYLVGRSGGGMRGEGGAGGEGISDGDPVGSAISPKTGIGGRLG